MSREFVTCPICLDGTELIGTPERRAEERAAFMARHKEEQHVSPRIARGKPFTT